MTSVKTHNYHIQMKKATSDIILSFIEDLFIKLTEDTPVDTGFARFSWQILKEGEVPEYYDFGPFYGPPSIGNLDWVKLGGSKPTIWNNAPYIMFLNEGWSEQAPSNFIDFAINDIIAQYS